MLVSKNAKGLRHPKQNPNASQWNIVCVGFKTQNSCVGHVHFILYVSILFALGSQCKRSFQWNIGFSFSHNYDRLALATVTEYTTSRLLWRKLSANLQCQLCSIIRGYDESVIWTATTSRKRCCQAGRQGQVRPTQIKHNLPACIDPICAGSLRSVLGEWAAKAILL